MNAILDKMIEVTLPNDEAFLIVRETLTRIGIASERTKTLYQSCHIFHKGGRYYITHFKLLFELDGKTSNFDEEDCERMKTIACLLESWGLLKINDKSKLNMMTAPNFGKVRILTMEEKKEWELVAKYQIGKKIKSSLKSEAT